MDNNLYIGTDIGGTTFTSGLFDTKRILINQSKKELISNFKSKKELINGITTQIANLIGNNKVQGIGVSCPGPLNSNKGLILNTPNLIFLQNCNIKNEIEKIANIPCRVENDANLFALGESNNIKNNKVFVGVTLGTGLGFGIIINGKLFTGGNGMAAEYGISPINKENWEAYTSIRWLEKKSSIYFSTYKSPKTIFKLAKENNKDALSIWAEYGKNLGICLSHIINILDPNKISIGGGLSNAFSLFKKTMIEEIKHHSPSYLENDIKIYESKFKEKSAMLGATLLFND